MASLTDKTRTVYLIVLILLLLAIGFFTFHYFGIINADEIFPFLQKDPNPILQDLESPTELEKMEIQKARESLTAEREEIQKLKEALLDEGEKVNQEKERLEELKAGIQKKEKEKERIQALEKARSEKVKILANKVANMPPPAARDMLIGWPDYDIIDVFEQMDKDAAEEGRPTITTYLLTLFSPERRSAISNKWLEYGTTKPAIPEVLED